MKEMDTLKSEFEKIKPISGVFLEEFYSDVKKHTTEQKISKGRLFNIRPFETERFGFKLGKQLSNVPKNKKDVQFWSFNSTGDTLLVERVGSNGEVQYSDFYFYSDSIVRVIGFYDVDSLAFVMDIIFDNGRVIKELSYGKFGSSFSDYNYNDDMLVDIIVHEKEHSQEEYSTHALLFSYDNGALSKIVKNYPNGYQEQRYP
ncbi:hypothetical protein [Dickeya oryzae]|uniref:Uncharacterized protein n=1 Tax=Dickeya oryzae TaxID=1240404 RepID=A0ABS5BHP6_9GAMM|nr:hypothetical protein [Dickeya oryzae]MBP2851822.1 hypothetical protein [Dickeya oryzae]MBP2859987.1 hypothetical protein [Dickeya oryzae]